MQYPDYKLLVVYFFFLIDATASMQERRIIKKKMYKIYYEFSKCVRLLLMDQSFQ